VALKVVVRVPHHGLELVIAHLLAQRGGSVVALRVRDSDAAADAERPAKAGSDEWKVGRFHGLSEDGLDASLDLEASDLRPSQEVVEA
jgi:hypothetical protein